MSKLSTVVLTKNEEENVERCLRSLDFSDEIIIVDDYSADGMLEKIQKFRLRQGFGGQAKIKIFQRDLNGDFAGQRNFGMEKVAGEWILFVDADEEISRELKKEIELVTSHKLRTKNEMSAYYIKRRDFFWGRELRFGETSQARNQGLIRLVKKNSGKWAGKVHEQFKVQSAKFKVQSLNSYLNHYPHQAIKEFLQIINFYSSLRAKELYENKKKTNIFEIIFLPLGKFFYNYLIKLGFLDGPAGFTYAFFMSFHSFLVRAKLYQYHFQSQNVGD